MPLVFGFNEAFHVLQKDRALLRSKTREKLIEENKKDGYLQPYVIVKIKSIAPPEDLEFIIDSDELRSNDRVNDEALNKIAIEVN